MQSRQITAEHNARTAEKDRNPDQTLTVHTYCENRSSEQRVPKLDPVHLPSE